MAGPPARLLSARSGGAAFAFVAVAIIGFSRGWTGGELVLDGPGVSLYVELVLDHWRDFGLTYWMPEMWAGTPAWVLAPSFHILAITPIGAMFGPNAAVKFATLAGQIGGGWGALVLARYFWGRTPAALVAGLAYGLHPLLVSHGALFGHETSLLVMGATPWLAWSLIRALGGEGFRYVVLAGGIAGFAVLQQAEHAYSLALLCGCLLIVELAKAKASATPRAVLAGILRRAALVVAIALGLVAHWLVPLVNVGHAFVFTPRESVRSELVYGGAGMLAREPGRFLERSSPLHGSVTLHRPDVFDGTFYLGWVAVGLTLLTVVLLGRRDRDGHLTAILLAGAIGMWMSTGAVPLADSAWATRSQLVPFAVIGATAGLLIGGLLRRLQLPKPVVVLGMMGAAAFLVMVPYLTPFLTLQQFIPLLAKLRFPRFYPIAALGLALGAAYPITLLAGWARRRKAESATLVIGAVALGIAAALLIDAAPYRSYYEVRTPKGSQAYRELRQTLDAVGGDFRLATPNFSEPLQAARLLDTGHQLSVGWPHQIAGRDTWRVTGEAMNAPPGWRDRALGLSATQYLAREQLTEAGPRASVRDVQLIRNPKSQPMVRSYEHAVVVHDGDIAPEMAVALAHQNTVVVTGDRRAEQALAGVPVQRLPASDGCALPAAAEPALAGEAAMACSMHNWVGAFTWYNLAPIGQTVGGVFRAPLDGLQGVSVWLDRHPGNSELVLQELGPNGESVNGVARRARFRRWDEDGLAEFAFEPLAGAAGKRYLFTLSCPECSFDQAPQMITSQGPRISPNLVVNGRLQKDWVAAFSLLYEGLGSAPAPSTTLDVTNFGTGRWEITATGTRPAVVVVAESKFPGWRAKVDGRTVPVLKADGAFLGVAVGEGTHHISLEYQTPRAAILGRALTVATLLALAGAWARSRRRRDRAPVPTKSEPTPANAPKVSLPAEQTTVSSPAEVEEDLPPPAEETQPIDEARWDRLVDDADTGRADRRRAGRQRPRPRPVRRRNRRSP